MNRTRSNSQVLWDLFASGTSLSYEKHQIIIRQDETPQGVYFIKSGFVKSYDITKYGEENLLVIRSTGQIFPILWTLTNERTDVFYEAMSKVEMLRIDKELCLSLLGESKEFTNATLEQVLAMYKIHSQRILNLEYRSAAERITFRLVSLAKRFGNKTKSGIVISVPLRHQDIAASTNCSRETASRELSKLEKKDLIFTQDGHIVIKDIIGMQKIIQNN